MNRFFSKIFSYVLLSSCVLLGASVFSAHAEPINENSVNIAAIFYGYGKAVQFSNSEHPGFVGAQIAVDELNLRGGILGKHVNLLRYNYDSTNLGASTSAKQAVADGVIGIVGPSWSSHSKAVGKIAQKAKIPMITPTGTNVSVTQVGDYIFRACFIDSFQGEIMASFAIKELGAKTALVLTDSTRSYSTGLSEYFIQSFQKSGGKILWQGEYLGDEIDFISLIDEAKKFSPDVIFVPGSYRDSGGIIKQARLAGMKGIFLSGDGWEAEMAKTYGDVVDGSYFSETWHQDFNQKSKVFVKKYKKRMWNMLSSGPLSYDAVMLLADASERAQSLDPKKIRDALAATTDFEGLGGKIQFDSNRNPSKPAAILKFENGDARFVKSFSAQ